MDLKCIRSLTVMVGALLLGLPCGASDAACKMAQFLSVPITMIDYKAVVTVQVNGKEAHLALDTGAFFGMLSPEAAKRLGLRVGPSGTDMNGSGGTVRPGLTNIKDFVIGNQTIHGLDMLVYGDQFSRGGVDGLLGQNLMRAGDIEIDLAHGVVKLLRDSGCGNSSLAYWAGSDPVNVLTFSSTDFRHPHVVADALVNDRRIRVVFDTGAGTSSLTLGAAARAGITPQSPGVVSGGTTFGIGSRVRDSWIAPFKTFKLDQEEIHNTRLRISELEFMPQNADMLLGADFFLSHHVLISYQLRKIFFTYNGGSVFDLTTHRPGPGPGPLLPAKLPTEGSQPIGAPAQAATPIATQEAPDLDRRATAEMERGDLAAAISDFGRAIAADPGTAIYHLHHGEALLRTGQPQQGMADVEAAIRMQPDLTDALMVRAQLRLRSGNIEGAHADFAAAEAAAPSRYELQLAESIAYTNTEHFQQALTLLNSWISAHPDDNRHYMALLNRCLVRGMLGEELDAALDDCNSARRSISSNSAVLFARGIVELRLKKYDKAIGDFSDTIKLQPRFARAFYARGIARGAKGDRTGAEADLRAATDMEPRVARAFQTVGLGP